MSHPPVRSRRPEDSALRVEGVSKRFGAVRAVNDASFTVDPGSLVCLIGPNGAGKSTLLKCVAGVHRQDSGRITLGDRDISGMRSDLRARHGLATVSQDTRTLHELDVLHNAMLGSQTWSRAGFFSAALRLPRHHRDEALAREVAYASLQRVGLAHMATEPADALPFGLLRLLAVARALTQQPKVLLLDEPAAGLRGSEKQALSEVFHRLREEGMTQVLVEHDMQFVNTLADRIVVLDHGVLIADGAPDDVLHDTRVRSAYLGVEAEA